MKKISELTIKKDELDVYMASSGYPKITAVIAGISKVSTRRTLTILKKFEKFGLIERVNSSYKRQIKWRITNNSNVLAISQIDGKKYTEVELKQMIKDRK